MERDATGRQAGTSSQIENYLGFPSGISGADLARRATAQAKRFGAEIVSAQDVTCIRRNDPYRVVVLSDDSELNCYAVLVASGMEVRRLEAPGVAELVGVGVYYGAALSEAAMYRDKHVFVIGGGNSGRPGRDVLLACARQVTVVGRRRSSTPCRSTNRSHFGDREHRRPRGDRRVFGERQRPVGAHYAH